MSKLHSLGMFGENDDRLKRQISDIILYHKEDQDENYKPTITISCGWFYDEEFNLPVYFYYDFEISRKKIRMRFHVWVEDESGSDRMFRVKLAQISTKAETGMKWIMQICCEICDKPLFNLSSEKDVLVESANDYKVYCINCFERRYL